MGVGRCMINLTNKPNSTMFRFVALFALVAVALAEPEADAQLLVNPYNTVAGVPVVNTYANHVVKPLVYNQVPVVNSVVKPVVYNQVPVVSKVVKPIVYKQVAPVVPVVKYVDPHHTEGMTEQGVPEKTDSVKIAEKHHEVAQAIENAKAKIQYVAPYNTYGFTGVYPYWSSIPIWNHLWLPIQHRCCWIPIHHCRFWIHLPICSTHLSSSLPWQA